MNNDLSNQMAEYLAASFRPIRLTTTLKQWLTVNAYSNPIFQMHTFALTPQDRQYYDAERLKTMDNVVFTTSVCSNYESKMFNHAVPLLAWIIGGKEYMRGFSANLDLSDPNLNEFSLITMDTRGKIPERFVKMLADFHLTDAKLDYHSTESVESVEKFWQAKTKALPLSTLESIGYMAVYAMDTSCHRVNVLQAPKYTPIGKMLESSKMMEELENRTWYTYDGDISPAVVLFFDQCKKYHSYYPPGQLAPHPSASSNYSIMSRLHACEGGIEMYYFRWMPWCRLRQSIFTFGSSYSEVRGHNNYGLYKGLPYEELAILSQALVHEGAEVEINKPSKY